MEDPTPDPALATGEKPIEPSATGQVYPNDDGDQILTSAGCDITVPVLGLDSKVTWMSHPDLDLVITFDEKKVLKKGDKDIDLQIKIKAKSKQDKNIYVVNNTDKDKSYYYDAELVTNDGRRRRCLKGKRDSAKEEAAFAETNTAIRPRIRVGDGGGILP